MSIRMSIHSLRLRLSDSLTSFFAIQWFKGEKCFNFTSFYRNQMEAIMPLGQRDMHGFA